MSAFIENMTDSENEDAFELDVQITTDVAVGYSIRRCDSSDTCGQTCGSACASS